MSIDIAIERRRIDTEEILKWLVSSENMGWKTVDKDARDFTGFFTVVEHTAEEWVEILADPNFCFGAELSEDYPLFLKLRFEDEELAALFKLTWL